jgi:sugar transferase (PEP-CTERM/EpsH1 system associated)
MTTRPKLIVHVVHRFDTGGLENGLVNLINTLPRESCRHAVVALTECGEIVKRIERSDVQVFALRKSPGNDLRTHVALFRLLRRLRPDVVHTRNVGTIEYQLVAWLAGVEQRIHGEHGWDTTDPHGASRKYRWLRRLMSFGIERFVALSEEIARWLVVDVGIPAHKLVRICNGVDTVRLQPRRSARTAAPLTVGTVTRFSAIKDPCNAARAFVAARERLAPVASDVRFIMVGDGPLRDDVESYLRDAGALDAVCLPGNALEVSVWYQRMDVFVLGSLREGISNTILEAMAAGLPIVATRVGGNPELIADGETGTLVPAANAAALADAIVRYLGDDDLRRRHGKAARLRAEREFSLPHMAERYAQLYRLPATIG